MITDDQKKTQLREKKTFQVRIPRWLLQQIIEQAAILGISRAGWLELAAEKMEDERE